MLERYIDENQYCYQGLALSNVFVEIAGKYFDRKIKYTFSSDGLIFYARYVDDGLLIFNKDVEQEMIRERIIEIAKEMFGNRVKLNEEKEKYYTKYMHDNLKKFTYLGYLFKFSDKKYKFGIAEETINHMQHKEKCVVTGNPIRSEILHSDYEKSREKLGIKKPFVLIFGGSLGADRINDTVIGMLDRISKDNKIELLFGTGDRNYDKIMNKIKESGITLSDNIKIVSYIDNMAECMAAADVVVSRAGAITVSEIAALGKPSILIPSPNVVRNHQEQNAREFENKNAAELILEKDLTSDALYDKIMSMVSDKDRLKEMSENLKPLAKVDALEKIYELMIKMAKGDRK